MNSHAGDLRLVGGRLCLDFVNTVDNHRRLEPKEYLVSYAAFAAWGQHAGLLDHAGHVQQLHESARRPQAAQEALVRIKGLRAALYQLFSPVAAHGLAPEADRNEIAQALATINAAVASAPQRSRIVQAGRGFRWTCDEEIDALEQPFWLLLWSAADLLSATDLALVGECEGEGCSWLFLDTSRKRSRRWCSMEDCGNRAKAKRHYARGQR